MSVRHKIGLAVTDYFSQTSFASSTLGISLMKFGLQLLGISLILTLLIIPFASESRREQLSYQQDDSNKNQSPPTIEKYGAVVQFPRGLQQPRDGSKLLIDVTKGGDPTKVNPALDKVARFLNIYASAGKKPAHAHFAVVFHGKATLAVLNSKSYAAEFGTDGNPNEQLLRQLHNAGVSMYVCGQSLNENGKQQTDVINGVDTAVSALTTIVNYQSHGFAYVPLF